MNCVNSASHRDNSCLGILNPSEELIFKSKNGYKVASTNKSPHPVKITSTAAGETKVFQELANCHHAV